MPEDPKIEAFVRTQRMRLEQEFENPAFGMFAETFSQRCSGALRELFELRQDLIEVTPVPEPLWIQFFIPLSPETIAYSNSRYAGRLVAFAEEGEGAVYLAPVDQQTTDSIIWFDWAGDRRDRDPPDLEPSEVTLGSIVSSVLQRLADNSG